MPRPTLRVSLIGIALLTAPQLLGAVYAADISTSASDGINSSNSVSPVPLLVEQCLRLPKLTLFARPTSSQHDAHTIKTASSDANIGLLTPEQLAQQALAFEQQTISLNNINDRLTYYRQFALSSTEREGLLQCQLRLADSLANLLAAKELTTLTAQLRQGDAQQIQLSEQLHRLLLQPWHSEDKAKLHTAQASVRQGLSSQHFQLSLSQTCQLSSSPADTHQTSPQASDTAERNDFTGSIAGYLLRQDNADCRQTVWQTYQARASLRNQAPLQRIMALRAKIAEQAGFADYTSLALNSQFLSTPNWVKQFLDSQTDNIAVAPWDLGRTLAAIDTHKATAFSFDSADALAQSFAYLTRFDIRVETLSETPELSKSVPSSEPIAQHASASPLRLFRVYHQQRLLGELYVSFAQNARNPNAHHTLRQAVIGQQFGQQALDFPAQLTKLRDITQFSNALAQAIDALAKGSHFYLINTLAPTQDTNQVAALWLGTQLQRHLLAIGVTDTSPIVQSDKAKLAQAYIHQLQVFRAKVALNQYQTLQHQTYPNLAAEFILSFGVRWDRPQDYAYSFSAIADEGPLYYQALWQNALAAYIDRFTLTCADPRVLFNQLVVNEAALTFNQQLTAIIGAPVDPASLIQRIAYDSGSETHASHSSANPCPF